MYMYLSLSSKAPAYLAAGCKLVSDEGRRQLRSATSRTCVVRRTYSNYGDRCSAAAGSKLWNSLPADLRQAHISFQRFKTFLFACRDRGALRLLLLKLRLISFLSYVAYFKRPTMRHRSSSLMTRTIDMLISCRRCGLSYYTLHAARCRGGNC